MASRDLVVRIIGDDRSLQRAYKESTVSTQKFDRSMSQTFRGAAAGSGVFRTLGRSLAFASGGFIAAASITDVIRGSINQATEAAKVQKQLAAQFKVAGQNLSLYQQQIDETSNSLSALAGIENDELKAAFVTAFRGTENVNTALKIQAIAADVARARGISLATATLALTKAYGGQSTALRRLGILVPPTLRGMGALNFVQQKFAGQAAAGTTAQERFAASFKNFEEAIGTAMLPTFNELLDRAAKWLNNTENQKKVQEDVTTVTKLAADAFGLLADAITKTADAYDFLDKHLPGGTGWSLMDFVRRLPGGDKSLLEILGLRGGGGIRPSDRPGQSTADRMPGRAPGGPGAFQMPAAMEAIRKQSSGLYEQFRRSTLALAKAQVTASMADDRRILAEQRRIIQAAISQTTNFKKRRSLYTQLAQVTGQIRSIDQQADQAREDARQKELDAEKNRLEAHREHIRRMRAAWQEQLQAIRDAASAVRGEFGALPFKPTPAGILGVSGQSAKGFVGAYVTQTRDFVRFYNDLARLRKMGAPAGLIGQLRGLGPEGAGLVRGLVTHPGQLRSLIRAFGQREAAVMQIAKADIHARIVHIHLGGSRPGATPASTRRGRNAGVPLTKDYVIGGG